MIILRAGQKDLQSYDDFLSDGSAYTVFCKTLWFTVLTLFSMGYFKNTTVWGAIMAPLVTSLFLKVEGQKLVTWGILMCLLQKWH